MRACASSFNPITALAVSALLIPTCGGEPARDEAPGPEVGGGVEAAATTSAATIRIVNLWVDDGSPAAIDVLMKPMLGEQRPLFENVAFGATSSAAAIPADVRLEVYRPGESGRGNDVGGLFLDSNDLEAAGHLTVVVSYHPPLTDGGPTAGFDVFHDSGELVIGSMPVRPVEGALLVAFVSPMNRVLGSRASLTFGIPGAGCLRPAGSTSSGGITTTVGGTAALTYDVPPGMHAIAAWDAGSTRCEGAPRIGPVDVDVAATSRTYVFAYATAPEDLRLVAVRASEGS